MPCNACTKPSGPKLLADASQWTRCTAFHTTPPFTKSYGSKLSQAYRVHDKNIRQRDEGKEVSETEAVGEWTGSEKGGGKRRED